MKISEFLRDLTDLIIKIESGPEGTDGTSDKTDTMVPPLQQELELLKKAVGVDSVFDDTAQNDKDTSQTEVGDPESVNNSNPELEDIKRNAGISNQ